jgi:hypothetical protein
LRHFVQRQRGVENYRVKALNVEGLGSLCQIWGGKNRVMGIGQQRRDAAGAMGIAVNQQEAQCIHIGLLTLAAVSEHI